MEDLSTRKRRAKRIFEILDPVYTMDKTALEYRSPFELLIATILSAQCTDRQVNRVTKTLFGKYRSPEDYMKAPISELEKEIRSTGFYKNKAKSIKGCCMELINRYGGRVPDNMEDLLRLPGVGRKTANCVLGAAFGVPGIVVDTHVKRLCVRMGLTENNHPDRIEKDVERLLPTSRWRRFSDILIYHGRAVCKARKPAHELCQVFHFCPSNDI
ncbi:MAG: endonuclease III [Deltaproteobacteria bacterium]|nr:endonuclease III [Deltaproteobacteria bacterium]